MAIVRLWVYDAVMASTVTGFVDVLAVANTVWRQSAPKASRKPLFAWSVESISGEPVTGAAGHPIAVDGMVSAHKPADAVVVFGPFVGGGVDAFLRHWEESQEDLQPMLTSLRAVHRLGSSIASVCSGAFLLAEAGLLDGARATTHWALVEAMQRRYPNVAILGNEVLVDNGRTVCSGAMTSYLNLALRLVERFGGTALASTVAKLMLIDRQRVSQASYRSLTVQAQVAHDDDLVAKAQRLLEQCMTDGIRLPLLADTLAVSERTLNRRFLKALGKTPLQYLQSVRIDHAKNLLEATGLSVEAVGEQVGYGDASTFRRLFKRETGLTPKGYQQRFGDARATRQAHAAPAAPQPSR
jgi:transcriptional regulator GlxA family with amidase domain